MEKTELVTHLIMNPDPEKFSESIQKFCADKEQEDISVHISSTTLPVNQMGQFMVIPSCVINWKCSKEQAVSYKTSLKIMQKII